MKPKDGEVIEKTLERKYYDEKPTRHRETNEITNWPPKHNDMSSQWVVLLVTEGNLTAEVRAVNYGATFTTKDLVKNWRNNGAPSISE